MQGSSVVFCHLWPVPLHDIFFLQNYLINGTIFGEKFLNTKCVFWFSLQLLSETFLILRGIQRCVINARRTCVISGFHHEVDENSPLLGYNPEEGSSPYIDIYVKYPLFLSNLNETWISSSYFREILKFHETPSSESLVVPCRRTDGRTDMQTDRWTSWQSLFAMFQALLKYRNVSVWSAVVPTWQSNWCAQVELTCVKFIPRLDRGH